LAKQKAVENGCYEAIQHRGETVTEGSSSNVFIVKNDELATHPATNLILNGITRQVLLDICRKQGIPVREEAST
ncbi:aminotransferase class IV, partial [Roseburia faecis]|uniref:aminotransferase class IV n=1 Tax=Roseburia faecis TaxID=301302 RepID=UPI001D08DB32